MFVCPVFYVELGNTPLPKLKKMEEQLKLVEPQLLVKKDEVFDLANEEVRKIKEKVSLEYLTQTPEERNRAEEQAISRYEAAVGRKLERVSVPAPRLAAQPEMAQV